MGHLSLEEEPDTPWEESALGAVSYKSNMERAAHLQVDKWEHTDGLSDLHVQELRSQHGYNEFTKEEPWLIWKILGAVRVVLQLLTDLLDNLTDQFAKR